MAKIQKEMLLRDMKVDVSNMQFQELQVATPGPGPGLQLLMTNFVEIFDSLYYTHG